MKHQGKNRKQKSKTYTTRYLLVLVTLVNLDRFGSWGLVIKISIQLMDHLALTTSLNGHWLLRYGNLVFPDLTRSGKGLKTVRLDVLILDCSIVRSFDYWHIPL